MSAILAAIQNDFPLKKVVIVGDLVADQFLNGTIARVSREAPVFILRHEDTVTLPGAAANAAVNVASLGGEVVLIGCIGNDPNGTMLTDALENAGVGCDNLYRGVQMKTTTKLRVLAGQHYAARQQVIRIDYENSPDLSDDARGQLRDLVASAAGSADAFIISDYGYGAVFPELFADALTLCKKREIPIIVDSRYGLSQLANATTATPNREEAEQILGADFTSDDCSRLGERLGLEALLVTNGNQGMSLFEHGKPPLHLDAVGSTEPVDVTGAGDTVIAAYSLGLAAGLSFADAATAANHAGGIVVMKKRTASVTADELVGSLRSDAERSTSHAQ